MSDMKARSSLLDRFLSKLAGFIGLAVPEVRELRSHEEFSRRRARKSYVFSVSAHAAVILGSLMWSLLFIRGCRHLVPAGIPMGKGDKLAMGKVVVIQTPKRIQRKRKVRKSPVSVYEMLKEEEDETEKKTAQQFSDNVGVPGGVGKGATAAGSPHGTALGGKLYFYRIKFKGPNWDANSDGVGPLMKEVLKSGVVQSVAGYNNVVTLKDLPRHSGDYMPALIYMTGTGEIDASDEEVANLRQYLKGGGMLFADVSGGAFHEHFVRFMRRVFPDQQLSDVEFDNEVYRGRSVPYAMLRGCPIYRKHKGAGPAMGLWIGPKMVVFYSRGDLGSGWAAAGIFRQRRRDVEQAYRMGVNIISYSLLYYKYTAADSG